MYLPALASEFRLPASFPFPSPYLQVLRLAAGLPDEAGALR